MKVLSILLIGLLLTVLGCQQQEAYVPQNIHEKKIELTVKATPELRHHMVDLSLYDQQPTEWGEVVTGVNQRFQTTDKEMALTFDACGGPYGSEVDMELITFLKDNRIAATLFVNEQWIHANKELFLELASHPLFEIENHGTNHSPLSVSGREAWGIPGTNSPQEAYDEIMNNHQTVLELTGHEMSLFRSGTDYYDEVAVQLANDLGYDVVNFDVLGDAGATYTSEQVKHALLSAKKGSIVLLHMNQPHSGTADGVKRAIPLLIEEGYDFVLLKDKQLE